MAFFFRSLTKPNSFFLQGLQPVLKCFLECFPPTFSLANCNAPFESQLKFSSIERPFLRHPLAQFRIHSTHSSFLLHPILFLHNLLLLVVIYLFLHLFIHCFSLKLESKLQEGRGYICLVIIYCILNR